MRSVLGVFLCVVLGCAKPITIAYQDRIGDGVMLVAVAKGFFEAQGLHVNPKRFASGPATSEALLFGDADFATMGDTAALIALGKYCPRVQALMPLGGGEERHWVVVPKSSLATGLEGLQGKRVAVKFGTSTHGGLLLKTQSLGLSLDKEMMDLAPSLMATALASGEVDAVVASEPTPSVLVERGLGKRLISLGGTGNTYPLLLMAKERSLKEHANALPALKEALAQSAAFIAAFPEETAQILSGATGLSLEATMQAMAYHFYRVGWEEADIKSLEALGEFLVAQGTLGRVRPLGECVAP